MGIKRPFLDNNNTAPIEGAVVVTPGALGGSFSNGKCRALWIGTTGDVQVQFEDSLNVVFKSVPVGLLWVACTQVVNTSTTAGNILACY